MRPTTLLALAAATAVSLPASAYCVHNDLKDRDISISQEEHPDWKRNDSRFVKTLKPGAQACCEVKNLDCNPNGRPNAVVGLEVFVMEGEPPLKCGIAAEPRKARLVKLMGAGTLRVAPNARFDPKTGSAPYVARVTSTDSRDVTGPAGLPCRAN